MHTAVFTRQQPHPMTFIKKVPIGPLAGFGVPTQKAKAGLLRVRLNAKAWGFRKGRSAYDG
jgi:hypothetical protein